MRYEHSLDEKGRVAIPKRFRDLFKAGIVLTRGFDRCLLAYPLDEWRKAEEAYAALRNDSPDVRTVMRHRRFYREEAELDSQGRVIIPGHLREYAGIEDGVIIGDANPRYLEIWSAQRFLEEERRMDEQVPELAKQLQLLQ
ncbi:MAG: division/cell wall cluster transcriptional repressor MraZ [Chloroflexi bacterium]|nr:division/cell wall cluster transcriptional repressor MraZ [Chloroflexota bacterium]